VQLRDRLRHKGMVVETHGRLYPERFLEWFSDFFSLSMARSSTTLNEGTVSGASWFCSRARVTSLSSCDIRAANAACAVEMGGVPEQTRP